MHETVEKFISEFAGSITAGTFVKLTLGNYKGADEHLQKVLVRSIKTRKGVRLSFQYRYDKRDVVKNYDNDLGISMVDEMLTNDFFSGHLFTTKKDFQITIGKKRKARMHSGKPAFTTTADAAHDRVKKTQIDHSAYYLKALGITTDEGAVRDKQQDKWRQINKFVETLASFFDNSSLKGRKEISIVDMGSGKGYLTFAAYDYFANVRGLKVEMTGVDTKQDMIDFCNEIARASEFGGLSFVNGTIGDYELESTDILIALHACNTATDDALFKGIHARAELIVVAPCCHHELRPQIKAPEIFSGILKHGVMLDRTAETVTDGLRALLLEREGYSTRIFEFISSEHTPKNNMIVGTRNGRSSAKAQEQIKSIEEFYGIESQHLQNLFELQRA